MKEQINKLLTERIHIVSTGNYHSVQGIIPTSEALEQIMCYREVRAIIDWVNWKWWEDDFTEILIEQLSVAYTRETVLKAIDQYKSELK